MSWARLATAAIGVVLAAMGIDAAAQAIVLRSTGPSAQAYPMGRKLEARHTAVLKDGDKVTVLDRVGTRVILGPGSFRFDAVVRRDASAAASLAALTAAGGRRSRTGAARGNDPAARGLAPPSIWYIDVRKGGVYCQTGPAALVLWRSEPAAAASGALRSAEGREAIFMWRPGSATVLWPGEAMPVADGGSYRLVVADGAPVTITVHFLARTPADQMELATMLADKGCTSQLGLMADTAKAPARPE